MRDRRAPRLAGVLAASGLLLVAGAGPAAAGSRPGKASPAPVAAPLAPVAWEPTLADALRAAAPAAGQRRPVFLLRVIGEREGCT